MLARFLPLHLRLVVDEFAGVDAREHVDCIDVLLARGNVASFRRVQPRRLLYEFVQVTATQLMQKQSVVRRSFLSVQLGWAEVPEGILGFPQLITLFILDSISNLK